jgi:homoserine kinase
MSPQFQVRVPATSANLGPGFDCLGIALCLFNEMTLVVDEPFSVTIYGEAENELPRDASNSVVQSIRTLLSRVGATQVPTEWRVILDNHIPIASGLGSSASAIVGGLLLANAMVAHYQPALALSTMELLRLATELEGHPDNVSPALFGGGSLTWFDVEELRYTAFPLPEELVFVVATPYFPLRTEVSRQVLPKTVSRADAVFNIAQTARLMIALSTHQLRLLRGGFGDKLHEPYRLPLIPGCLDVRRAALVAGALTTTLSGSGPSQLAWCDSEVTARQVADTMTLTWRENGMPCRTDLYHACQTPTRVSVS